MKINGFKFNVVGFLCAAALIAGFASGCGQRRQLTLRAFIDGRDVVKVSGDKLWFEHETAALPGRTIYVNGKAWTPDWTNNVSTEFMGLTPAFRSANAQDIQITKRAGRGIVSIAQFPSPANEETLAVRLDDDIPGIPGGADWYEIVVSW